MLVGMPAYFPVASDAVARVAARQLCSPARAHSHFGERMSAKQLKAELSRLGIPHSDCFEINELVSRLASSRPKPLVSMPMDIITSSSYANSGKDDLVVSLNIGGRGPFKFLIDTGSSATIIRPELAWNELQIPSSLAIRSAGIGASTSFSNTYAVPLPPVTIGTCSCKPVQAVVVDLSTRLRPSVSGIMGMDMISQFDVEFDFLSGKLSFYSAGVGSQLARGMEELVTSSGSFQVPYVQVEIGSSPPQTALLDLGCSLCVASRAAARSAGMSQDSFGSRPALGGFGLAGSSLPFLSTILDVRLPTLSGSKLELKNVNFAVGDLPAMTAMGTQVLLGLHVFRQTRLVLSMSTKSVFLELRT